MEPPFSDNPLYQLPIPLTGPDDPITDFPVNYEWDREQVHTESSEDPPAYKPFPFALRPAPNNQIHIYFGVLVHQVNKMYFSTEGLVTQAGLSNPQVVVPSNLDSAENRYKFYTLDWRGDVFLYWETDSEGIVTYCDVRGPSTPTSQALPNDLGGKFYVRLGTIDEDEAGYVISNLDQNISSDVYWITAFGEQLEESSASSDSSSSAGSDSVSDSGSDKSTAIVPMPWHEKGYGALFTMESNEVLFEFVLRDIEITEHDQLVPIDDRFLHVCAPNSMCVTGVTHNKGLAVGTEVIDKHVRVRSSLIPFLRPDKVTLKLTGVRKGFAGMDMPERSRNQFEANERFINSAYPKE